MCVYPGHVVAATNDGKTIYIKQKDETTHELTEKNWRKTNEEWKEVKH